MIVLTVKTLDSNNHTFEVEAESTVAQLKEKIREALGLELDRQRLIFCGRVLQDDQILNESGVDDGKCLHLVQRPPPSPPSRRRDRDRMEGNAGDQGGRSQPFTNIRHLLSPSNDLLMEQQMASISPTAGRLNFIRGIITEIRGALSVLRNRAGDLAASGGNGNDEAANMETDSSGEAQAQPETAEERDDGDEEEEQLRAHAQTRRHRTARSTGPRFYANPRDLGRMLEELDQLHDDFAPFRAQYVAMLRNLTLRNYQETERQQWQELVRLICDIMHSFAHCYHLISDITFNVGQRYPRLTSEPPASTRHTIPVQAHINVVTATGPHPMSGDRRGAGAGNAGAAATTATTTTSATATATSANSATASATRATPAGQASTPRPAAPPPAAPDTDLQTTSETFNVRRTSATDRTPIHTTTRTFTRPSTEGSAPASYQVEIETRGHIAIPIDNNLLSGLAAVASNLRQAQGQHDRAIADAQAARAAATAVRPESDPMRVPTSNRRQNLPPALIALENLDLWGALGSAASTAPDARSAPTAPSVPSAPSAPPAPSASSAPSAPSQSGIPVYDPVRDTVQRRVQQAECQSENVNSTPVADQPSTPAAPAAQTASGSTFLGSAPINIGPRSAPVQGATAATANASQRSGSGATRGPSGATGGATSGASGATGSTRPRTGAVPRTSQPHVHVTDLTRLLEQPADGSRPRILMDLDNLMRNMSGGVGMEVVMSMEDMPNFLAGAGLDADINDQAGVYVTPLFAAHNVGATPTADLLQNIVAIVRNRMMPQDPPQNQGQSQNRGHGQAQNQGQSQNQGSDQSNAERRNQWQAPWGGLRRRARDTEYPYAMACLVYDRYLNCDSVHARHRLQERREIYQRQAEEERRRRLNRAAAPDIENIRASNPRFTFGHIATMERLLNEPTTRQGQLNAFMTTIARRVFLYPTHRSNEPTLIPTEFARIRIQLRDYVRGMLNNPADAARNMSSFEGFAERVIDQIASILHSLPSIQTREAVSVVELDPTESVRAMLHMRAPTVVACIMSEAGTSMSADRFYNAVYQFFGDFCALILSFLDDDFDELVRRYDDFMENLTENYGSSTRNWLRVLAHENLIAIRSYIQEHSNASARQYLRQADGSMPPPYARTATAAASEDGQDRQGEQEEEAEAWMSGSESHASGHEAGPLLRSEGSSATGSPSHPRLAEPQAEAEERSAAESVVSEPSPRRLRRWGRQSASDSQSLASDLTSESHPPGLIAIALTDTDSLFDVEELDVAALVDDIDPFVGDYTEIRRTVVHSPMNIIEDVDDDAVKENVDDEAVEEDPSLMAEDLEIRRRREKRERSIRRDVARRRLEGNVRHKKFITMEETERRLDLRAMRQSARKMDYDCSLHMALDRAVEEIRQLDEAGEQAHGTDEGHDEISEVEPSNQEIFFEEEHNSAQGSDEHPDDSEFERIQQDLEFLYEELEILREHPLLQQMALVEDLVNLNVAEAEAVHQLAVNMAAELLDNELAEEGAARVRNQEMLDEFELLYIDHVTMIPVQMSQLNINEPEFLRPISVPRSNDAARDGNDFESRDESGNEYLLPIHRAAPAARDGNDFESYNESGNEYLSPIHRAAPAARDGNDFESYDESGNEYLSPIHRAAPAARDGNDFESHDESGNEYLSPIHRAAPAARDGIDFECHDESDNEYLSPIHRAAPAARDGDDFKSHDESDNEYLSPIHRADDDWYSLPRYRFPYAELDHDGYYSPQLSMYHERPGFLTPQPMKANAAARPSAATTKSVSDLSEECYDEGYDDFNTMVAQLRVHIRESSEPERVASQTPETAKKDEKHLASEIAENDAETNNAETGRKDIPHTSDDLDLATQAPMDSIMEDEEWRSIMGSSWEPVMREDGAAQSRGGRPQPPFSDAYLSGMPARKRRCLRDSRPEATLDALMDDDLRGVSEVVPSGLHGGEDAEITQLLRDSVRGLVAARARDQPEDYDPTRFPNTAAFLSNADRTKRKEQDEKNPTPPKSDLPDSVE